MGPIMEEPHDRLVAGKVGRKVEKTWRDFGGRRGRLRRRCWSTTVIYCNRYEVFSIC